MACPVGFTPAEQHPQLCESISCNTVLLYISYCSVSLVESWESGGSKEVSEEFCSVYSIGILKMLELSTGVGNMNVFRCQILVQMLL